jgi:hypothetical protein
MSVSDTYLAATVNAAAVAKHHGVKAFINMSQMTLALLEGFFLIFLLICSLIHSRTSVRYHLTGLQSREHAFLCRGVFEGAWRHDLQRRSREHCKIYR